MRINRPGHRPLEVGQGRADRDPMFKPVWYDTLGHLGLDTLAPEPEPAPEPLQLLPLPPIDPKAANWALMLARAEEVNAVLRQDDDFDSAVLLHVVCDLVDQAPQADEIIAAYRKRMAERTHG